MAADTSADHPHLPPAEQAIFAAILRARRGRWLPWLVVAALLLLTFGTAAVLIHLRSARLPGWSFFVFPTLVSITCSALYRVLLARWQRRQLPRLLADRGYCGSCAYPLRPVPPDADGCRVCPECGGAWRVPAPGEAPTDREFESLGSRRKTPARAVRDAAGRTVPLLAASALLPTGHSSPIPHETRVAISERWGRLGVPGQRAFARLIRYSLYACVAATLVLALSSTTRSLAMVAGVAAFTIAVGSALVAVPMRFAWRRRFAHFVAREGYCPSCGASLAGGEARGDGLVACPGCPAVWKPGAPLP